MGEPIPDPYTPGLDNGPYTPGLDSGPLTPGIDRGPNIERGSYGRPTKPFTQPESLRPKNREPDQAPYEDHARVYRAHREPSIKEPRRYPAPFSLEKGEDGAEIWFGSLCYAITQATFKRFSVDTTEINGFIEQAPIPQVQLFGASNLSLTNAPNPLEWWGDVFAYWEANEDGEVTLFEIRGPDEPEGEEIGVLTESLEPREVSEGKYYVKIGNVPESGDITQDVAGNVPWFVTIFKGIELSSGSSSSSSEESTLPSSGSSSSSSASSEESSSSGSSKDSAIVPVAWSSTGYAALFTVEAPDVRFEDVFVDLKLHGRRTCYPVDPKFLVTIEQDTLRVVGVSGDLPYCVGAEIINGGSTLVLNALTDARRRPNLVNVKVSALRRGFRNLRMPERTQKQFDLNERRLDLNTFEEEE